MPNHAPHSPLNADLRIAFFGTPEFAVIILDELKKAGIVPKLVVTAPDKPQGRGLIMTPPPVKIWAEKEHVPFIQPPKLRDPLIVESLKQERWDMFIVCAYGKIMPRDVLDIPLHNTLNVHPSLLPKYRGPSPLQSALLADDRDAGVSIMILDEEVDHGPVLAQGRIDLSGKQWPLSITEFEHLLAHKGGALLAEMIPQWVERTIEAVQQEHHKATFTKKIEKEDGLIDLAGNAYQNYLKIQAFRDWPGTYFFVSKKSASDESEGIEEKKIRVIIKEVRFHGEKENGTLEILRVVPEGKKEMDYKAFLAK